MNDNKTPSAAKLRQLANARSKRAIAAERIAPEGWRSVGQLLGDTREFVGSSLGRLQELANYAGADPRHVARWLRGERLPTQPNLNLIAQWRRNKASGL